MGIRFLGRGWAFPVDLGADGKVQVSSEEAKIQQSALLILGTARGERVMRPDFGSRLHELVFSTASAANKSLIARYATDALVQWESRIDVLGVSVREDSASAGTLLVDVEYRIRATQNTFNLVYPFYLKGGRG